MQDAGQPGWDEAVPVVFLTEGHLTDGIAWCLGVPVAGAVGFHWLTVLPPSNARPEKNGIKQNCQRVVHD